MERCSVLVVGAGLAGLSAAYHLRQSGLTDIIVIEAEDRPGGWAKTDWTGDWGADRAIHVLYFRDPLMHAWVHELLGGAWHEHVKRSVVNSGGVTTPFPFHANLHGRPPEVVMQCLDGVWDAARARSNGAPPPLTFADWIALAQGAGVAKHFMNPYNTKQWTVPPTEMGWDWMGDFVPEPEPRRILEGALRPATGAIGRNATFHYATRGASDLADALAARAGPVRPGTALTALRPLERLALLGDGSSVAYDALVSTIPLKSLGALLAPLPEPECAAWRRLESIDLLLADVGFRDPEPGGVHWAYLPDADVLPYRLHVAHELSPHMVPPGHGLYCLEISHSRHRPLPEGDLRERLVGDLVRTGWLRTPGQVVFYRERRFECSYVLPRVGFRRDAQTLSRHASELGIHSVGRYGEWKYCNQEDALLDGKRIAECLASGARGCSRAVE